MKRGVSLSIDPQSSILSPGGRALYKAASHMLDQQENPVTLRSKTLLVTLRLKITEREMDQSDKDELAEMAKDDPDIDPNDSGFDDHSARDMAEQLEQGLIENPEVFAGSLIWAGVETVKVESAEFVDG